MGGRTARSGGRMAWAWAWVGRMEYLVFQALGGRWRTIAFRTIGRHLKTMDMVIGKTIVVDDGEVEKGIAIVNATGIVIKIGLTEVGEVVEGLHGGVRVGIGEEEDIESIFRISCLILYCPFAS